MQLPYASEPVRTSFDRWLEETVERHRRELTFTEIRKGVQALSALYVERRGEGGLATRAVEGRGKRAALACYYAPLHFLTVHHALRMAGDELPAPRRIVDLGCGTGAVGAAAALTLDGACPLVGCDRSGWALDEARETWSAFGLAGRARRGDLPRGAPPPEAGDLWCCGWFVSELDEGARADLLRRLRRAVRRGGRVLVAEPLSTRVSPWWQEWTEELARDDVRSELIRVSIHRPRFVAEMDKAARLDHQVIGARVLIGPPAAPSGV
jgi:SAM-dependent methyltransferase